MNTLGRRLIGAIPVLLGISFLIFLLMHIAPGDPVTLLLGDDATPADIERTRHEWGLDQPLIVQYYDFVNRAVRGDFGKSLKFNESVTKLVAERLPATLELAFASLCVAIMIAVPLGVYSAIKHNSLIRPCRHEYRADRRVVAEFLARHHADLFSRRAVESFTSGRPDRVRH